MRTNGHHEVIARIAGHGLVLAASLAMVLSSSSAGRAQTSAASPTAPAATPAKTTPPAQVARRLLLLSESHVETTKASRSTATGSSR